MRAPRFNPLADTVSARTSLAEHGSYEGESIATENGRCRRCNSPLHAMSSERTWENACPECDQPIWLWSGDVVRCKVTRILRFGVAVEVAPGIEGWIHISELGENVGDLRDVLQIGHDIKAGVLTIDPWERKIGLSSKRVID